MRLFTETETEGEVVTLTPLIDVLFLLIIFFMAATEFYKADRELSVEVPQTEHAEEPTDAPSDIIINVLLDGRIVVGGETVDEQALTGILVRTQRQDPESIVRVRGDLKTQYGTVVRVVDLASGVGLERFALETAQK